MEETYKNFHKKPLIFKNVETLQVKEEEEFLKGFIRQDKKISGSFGAMTPDSSIWEQTDDLAADMKLVWYSILDYPDQRHQRICAQLSVDFP